MLFSKPASLSLLSRHLLKSFVCWVRSGWAPPFLSRVPQLSQGLRFPPTLVLLLLTDQVTCEERPHMGWGSCSAEAAQGRKVG